MLQFSFGADDVRIVKLALWHGNLLKYRFSEDFADGGMREYDALQVGLARISLPIIMDAPKMISLAGLPIMETPRILAGFLHDHFEAFPRRPRFRP